ncbi:MAG: DUF5989 family protein [Rhodospirillales bacterium]|nr:DUF5989 family protein [Rhodospirillales bacterium]MDP6646296.1 DUF5989 family protein [Rhodospirillales bacterium]
MFIIEIWEYMRARKKLWLLPLIIMLAVFGSLLVLSQGSVLSPLIYTMF